MKIGIIGSGEVGKSLARGFLSHGYEVMMGTQHKTNELKAALPKAKVGSFAETAAFGDLVVLAVKGTAAKDALALAGKLDGKIVIDVTNPIADAPPENGVLRFFTSLDKSLMEQLQAACPKARFVKAFNSIGNAYMVNPKFKEKPSMFICGNDDEAKAEVSKILEKFGFEPEDMGKAEAARAIEPLCMLWCIPGFARNDWGPRAFKLLK
jgi:hypothetical protein